MLISPQQGALLAYLEHIGVIESRQQSLPPFRGDLIKAGRSLLKDQDTFHVQAEIHFSKESGMSMTRGYKAVLVRLPPQTHATYSSIDTARLDKRMSAINWGESYHGIYGMSVEARQLHDDVLRLSKMENEAARVTADMLMLRHWVMAPLEHLLTGAVDRDLYYREMFFPLGRPDMNIDAPSAYNLMCGRAVAHGQELNLDGSVKTGWTTLDGQKLTHWPEFDVAAVLKRLPFEPSLQSSPEQGLKMVRDIAFGLRADATLRYRGKPLKVGIEADPRNGTLAIFDASGKQLHLAALKQKFDPLKKRSDNKRKGKGL